ncbi:MAG: beta-eliminating lyase-related protein [Christensenellales bacterium]
MSTWLRRGCSIVSQPTEIGTVYHLDELKALREVCDRLGLILFVDGARLGSALTSPECDMTLKDLAALADCFYIGGTKMACFSAKRWLSSIRRCKRISAI